MHDNTNRNSFFVNQDQLITIADSLINTEGETQTAIPSLSLFRSSAPTRLIPEVVNPSICFVIQGGKKVHIGNEVITYDAGSYFVASVDMPVAGQIIKASSPAPALTVKLELDPEEIVSIAVEAGMTFTGDESIIPGAYVGRSDADLQDAILRLIRLLKESEAIPVLAEPVKREITYRLLKKDGSRLYQHVVHDSPEAGIGRAINWIKDHYHESVKMEMLAEKAAMSVSGFHRKFKAVTTMTPLQYQKQLRLQEARRLLLTGADAATAAFEVGYESPSQFSREYRRLFGAPPIKDVEQLKKSLKAGTG